VINPHSSGAMQSSDYTPESAAPIEKPTKIREKSWFIAMKSNINPSQIPAPIEKPSNSDSKLGENIYSSRSTPHPRE
jgi:hypothetical protein